MKIVRMVLKVATLVALAVSSVIFVWFLAWVFWLASDYFSPDQGLNQLFDEASQRFAREQGLSEEEFMGPGSSLKREACSPHSQDCGAGSPSMRARS